MNNSIDFKIKSNVYNIKFPTTGQLVDIENLKASLSNGAYGKILASATQDSNYALDVIDVEAYLTILCPEFFEQSRIKSIRDLSVEDSSELIVAFKEQVISFINEWREVIKNAYIGKKEE